ncbi:NAC domain-containing protein 35 [Bienertia sinuspersici]
MAIATTMNLSNVDININTVTSNNNNNNNDNNHQHEQQQQQQQQDGEDEHEHDMVMPGFRFHPTEEELVEFYLRRKVEGKKFNVELISFLDLYRYDPWELPAIGEKEWFFYVPRDRKYRNGDRPNRVTTSGYWKATGADRMIRGENCRPIGLKKTLVFYSGKAPKGIRTSWIMNEYRLPQHDTERYQKAEISLCRVYKRPGVEDHPSVPRGSLPSKLSSCSRATSSSSDRKNNYHNAFRAQTSCLQQQQQQQQQQQMVVEKVVSETDASSSTEVGTALGLSRHGVSYTAVSPLAAPQQSTLTQPPPPPPPQQQPQPQSSSSVELNRLMHHMLNNDTSHPHPHPHPHNAANNNNNTNIKQQHQLIGGSGVITSMPSVPNTSIFMGNSSAIHPTSHLLQHHQPNIEEVQRLVEYQQACINHHFQQQQQQFNFEGINNNNNSNNHHHNNNPSSSGSNTTNTNNNNNNNLPFLFSNYLFSSTLNNNPVTVAATGGGGGGGGGLQLPTLPGNGSGALAFADRSLWDWNPYSEPANRDQFSNLFK